MADMPFYIHEDNVSVAWAKAFINTLDSPGGELTPLILTIDSFVNNQFSENIKIIEALTLKLSELGKQPFETVAKTIFPHTLWNPAAGREQLFTMYKKIYPKLVRLCRLNKRGTYFGRMIFYNAKFEDPTFEDLSSAGVINQLEHIINTFIAGNHRRSALQASIFDPRYDHTNQRRQGFPCLHQVAFLPQRDTGLHVLAYYPLQYLVSKAYGNYIGLCRLGAFMAHEMGLELRRFTCIAGVAEIDSDLIKRQLQSFKYSLQSLLK